MKILVLQMARLGDIYLSWPTLRALKRNFPQAQVHVLVRPRFAGALEGLEVVSHVWTFPSQQLAEKLLAEGGGLDEAKMQLRSFINQLRGQNFHQVINLSFSPLSSFLTHSLESEGVNVRGYTRHEDGFLHLPDDASSYFYAQVGVGKINRLHLRELLAEVAGVQLKAEDMRAPPELIQPQTVLRAVEETPMPPQDPYVIVQMGASQSEKQYPQAAWLKVLSNLEQRWDGQILLVGTAEESLGAAFVSQGLERVHNWCGRSSLAQLISLVQGADLVLGGDSLLMHIASLTETRCLNLSSGQVVNFWETGPLTLGSRILLGSELSDIEPGRVVDETLALLQGEPPQGLVMERVSTSEGLTYRPSQGEELGPDFTWSLVQAIYLGQSWPILEDHRLFIMLQRLNELCDLALSQLEQVAKQSGPSLSSDLLTRIEEMISQMALIDSRIQPLVAWVQTEQVRLGPGSLNQVVEGSRKIYRNLKLVLSKYVPDTSSFEKSPSPYAE